MHPPTVAVLVAAVAFLAGSTPGTAAAPAPGELWSEFPLESPRATTPAPARPTPAVERPEPARDDESDGEERPTLLLVLLGALVAVVGAFAGQRFATQQAPPEDERKGAAAVVRTVELPISAGGTGGTGRVAVGGRTASFVATGTTPTLIETLSPQARLADRLEETGVDGASEAHEVCEIACWRGYVSWQFYAELKYPVAKSVCSPYFRAPGKGAPQQTAAARRAHELLVEKLFSTGWEPQDGGEHWFATRFQRASRVPSA